MKTTDDILKDMKAALAEHEAEAARLTAEAARHTAEATKLRAMLAVTVGAEGRPNDSGTTLMKCLAPGLCFCQDCLAKGLLFPFVPGLPSFLSPPNWPSPSPPWYVPGGPTISPDPVTTPFGHGGLCACRQCCPVVYCGPSGSFPMPPVKDAEPRVFTSGYLQVDNTPALAPALVNPTRVYTVADLTVEQGSSLATIDPTSVWTNTIMPNGVLPPGTNTLYSNVTTSSSSLH